MVSNWDEILGSALENAGDKEKAILNGDYLGQLPGSRG